MCECVRLCTLCSLVPRLPPLARNYCVTFELVHEFKGHAIIARKGGEPGNEAIHYVQGSLQNLGNIMFTSNKVILMSVHFNSAPKPPIHEATLLPTIVARNNCARKSA